MQRWGIYICVGYSLLGLLVYLTISGCKRQRQKCAERKAPKKPGPGILVPEPTHEAREENLRRLDELAAIEQRGATPADIPRLIDMLDAVVPMPPSEAKPIPEGYAQERAGRLLSELGEAAYPALVEGIRNPRYRFWCFSILATEGRLEGFDEIFKLPPSEGAKMYRLAEDFLPSPTEVRDFEALKRWYSIHRDSLVFDEKWRVFRLKGS